jgi:hypothetical protein
MVLVADSSTDESAVRIAEHEVPHSSHPHRRMSKGRAIDDARNGSQADNTTPGSSPSAVPIGRPVQLCE